MSKTLNDKEIKSPWINDYLKDKMKTRDKLFKLASKNRIDKQIYKDFRNHLTGEIRRAKSNFYEEEFTNSSSNIKKTWSIINDVIRSKKSRQNINITDENGSEFKGSDVSIKCIDYFTSIAENLTSQLPDSPINLSEYLCNRNGNSFIFQPTSPVAI